MTPNGQNIFHEVDIEINTNCNMKCSYCPNSQDSRVESGEMDDVTFIKIIAELKEINYKGKVCFHFYNEPLLCSKLEIFIRIVKRELPECILEIVTNGTLLTHERLVDLEHLGVNIFRVTKHEGLTEIPLDNYQNLLSTSLKDKVKYKKSNELQLTNRGGMVSLANKELKFPLQKPCLIPKCLIVITKDGNVLPCYEDYSQKMAMGSVKKHSIMEIWNSEKFVNFRSDLKKGSREIYELCHGCDNTKLIV